MKKSIIRIFMILTIILSSGVLAFEQASLYTDLQYVYMSDNKDALGNQDMTKENAINCNVSVNYQGRSGCYYTTLAAQYLKGTDTQVNGYNELSMSCWINRTATANDFYHIIGYGGGAGDNTMLDIDDRVGKDWDRLFLYTSEGSFFDPATTISTQNVVHLVTMTYNGSVMKFFRDAIQIGSNTSANGTLVQSASHELSIGNSDSWDANFDGYIFDCYIWNRSLEESEISALWNSSNGDFYDDIPPVTIEVSLKSPTNDSQFNTLTLPVAFEANFTDAEGKADCRLYRNGILKNSSTYTVNGTNTLNDNDFNFTTESYYDYYVSCNTTADEINSSTVTILIDNVDPMLDQRYKNYKYPSYTGFTNDSSLFLYSSRLGDNHTMLITGQDVNLYSMNITTDANWSYSSSRRNLNTTTYSVNVSIHPENLATGLHWINTEVCDGHTKAKIKDFKVVKGSKSISFLNTEIVSETPPSDIKYTKLIDRYSFDFEYSVAKKKLVFNIPEDCDYIKDSKYKGHFVCYKQKTWIDFEGDHDVKVNGHKVTVTSNKPKKVWSFNSVGSLNCINKTYSWYKPLITTTAPATPIDLLVGHTYQFDVNVTFNKSWINETRMRFKFNGSTVYNKLTYDTRYILGDLYSDIYTSSYTVPQDAETTSELEWLPSLNNYDNWNVACPACPSWRWMIPTTSIINQVSIRENVTTTRVYFGLCNASNDVNILNLTYFDESTEANIKVNNSLNLVIYDGSVSYNLTINDSNTLSTYICTNIPNSDANLSYEISGSMEVNRNGYPLRTFTWSEDFPIETNNSDGLLQPIYMIILNDSTTLKFNWLSTAFQPLDGVMKIYRCDADGGRTLVESASVLNGETIVNLNIQETSYSYIFEREGIQYTDGSWYPCHIEPETITGGITYYVNIQEAAVLPVIGLFMVDCYVEKVSSQVARVTWSANTEDTTAIEGCLVAYRTDLGSTTEIFRNCTNATSGSLTNTIANNSFVYYVHGEIFQGGVRGYCQNTLVFNKDTTNIETFTGSLLISTVIMLLGFVLIWAGTGTTMLMAGAVAIILSWGLGIFLTSAQWPVISAIAFFLLIIALVGRYSKKR